jgi:hypothetical protein
MRDLRVDTELMASAMGNIRTSAELLTGEARSRLESIVDRAVAAGLCHHGDAEDKAGGFRDLWCDELEILGDSHGGFDGALTSAADAYDGIDHDIAAAIESSSAPRS